MKEDPPPDARCRDKFLVQSVAIAGDNSVSNIAQIWSNIEQTAKSSIQEKKIRVNFLPAEGTAGAVVGGATTNGITHHDDEPPAYSSPSPAAVTPQRASAKMDEKSVYEDGTSDATALGVGAMASSAVSSAAAKLSSTAGISQADLQKQLDDAKATITRLQQQVAEQTGLRQRKADSSSGTSAEKTHPASMATQQAPGGVPIHYVALLCFVCFIIAYMFF